MKVYTKDGVVFAEAETIEDIKSLFAMKEVTTKKETPKEAKPKKAYKKQYARSCDICGKKVKGAIGLGIHKSKAHPVAHQSTPQPQADNNQTNQEPQPEPRKKNIFHAVRYNPAGAKV